jgi:lipopolysaccharide/colanic/teichoic acid biosynthesis glycosyltransferase
MLFSGRDMTFIKTSSYAGTTPIHARPRLTLCDDTTSPIPEQTASKPRTSVQIIQRGLDLICAAAILLALMPVFAVIALLIRLDSCGPVLFTQTRVGEDGHEFPFFKFRSMVADAEARRQALEAQNERSGPVFKMKNDPRITRIGRVLRKYSLDEFPQLLNVLRGEMSLVGPRPALPREVALYTDHQRGRLAATPGLTGLWQVSGRASLTFEESIALDLHYIEHQSLHLNFLILLKTIPAVLQGDGAY